MKIYQTRHGRTPWNDLHKIQGQTDIHLNDIGKLQAQKIGEKLINYHIDKIYSSPLSRAMETSQIINSFLNVPIISDARISERNLGKLEGLKRTDFNFYEYWDYRKNIHSFEVESVQDFFTRVYNFIDFLKSSYSSENILVVSHNGVSIPFACYFNGLASLDDLPSLLLENCEIREYEL